MRDEELLPPCKDPQWREWTAPLLEFLQEPRTWPELEVWRKSRSPTITGYRFVNMLAWLEDRRRARSEQRDGEIVWMLRR